MARVRDEEAIKIVSEIAGTLDIDPKFLNTALLIGQRAYRKGTSGHEAKIAMLEVEVHRLRREVEGLRKARGWSFADLHYIRTLKTYGMTAKEVASVMHSTIEAVREALLMTREKSPKDRKPASPRRRAIDAG